MREQQQEEEDVSQRTRPLTKAEVNTLKVATLTEADIQKSKRLAQPASIHSTYHSAESLHSPHVRTSLPTPCSSQAEITVPEPARVEETRKGQMAAILQRAKSTPLLKLLKQQSLSRKPSASSFVADIHEENCAVCLDDFVAGDKVRQLPCKHYFHKACIDPWLCKNSAVCPLCNFNVSESFTN
ncbi:hypothetical protein LPJ79_000229 [Coemansia sp. RSA 1821]|nr:hypothetical protein LPJ79_000229 [Coemansia sp. RSA 1821]